MVITIGVAVAALQASTINAPIVYPSNLAFAGGAAGFDKYSADLSSKQEVPPTNSTATGMVVFFPNTGSHFQPGTLLGDNMTFTVNVTTIEGATAGHIHSGKQDENGPIVVTLFKYDSPMNQVLESGTITEDGLEGSMTGKQVSDLQTAMNNGLTYVNIHTEENPEGEIRGQIYWSGQNATGG